MTAKQLYSTNEKVSKLILLFPCTYIVHIAEEYWCGERFFNWLSRVAQAAITEQSFLILNLIFLVVMLTATCIAIFLNEHRIVVVLASIVLINTLLHLFGSIITFSYSPGLISAMIMWLPLSVWVFKRERKRLSGKQIAFAVAVGVIAHIFVSGLAILN